MTLEQRRLSEPEPWLKGMVAFSQRCLFSFGTGRFHPAGCSPAFPEQWRMMIASSVRLFLAEKAGLCVGHF
jgi:hypothetical protein